MKGIIYSRVSTDRQNNERQIDELKQYAKRNDIEVLKVFTDSITGSTKAENRKGAKQMYEFIEANKIDIVLVSEISRLGRSAIDVQKNIDTIVNQCKLNLFIYQQGMTARTKTGKLNATFKLITDVLANVAEMEREQISERVRSGLELAKKKGKHLGRPKGTNKNTDSILSEYKQVIKNLRKGLSIRKVAKLCEVSPSTVQKVKALM